MPELQAESLEVQLVDPAEVEPDEAADPAARPDIDFLQASLNEKGQQVPAVIRRHPEPGGRYKYKMIDGNGRQYCLQRLRRPMSAIVLDRAMDEVELIELEVAHNAIRRSMTLPELAAKAERHMELTGGTQRETGARLKCSDATISRALAVTRRIPAELRADAYRLGSFFVSLIAPLPTPEAMGKAIAFAGTPRADGRKPSREQVVAFVAGLKGRKPARAKRLRLRVEGRGVEVELRPGDSAETLIKAFKAALGRLEEHRKLPLEAVAAVLADREPKEPSAA
jgi:ParB/RepB/Spo0J family partition protein